VAGAGAGAHANLHRELTPEMIMSSTDVARSVLAGMLHCVLGSVAAGLLSGAVLLVMVRLLA